MKYTIEQFNSEFVLTVAEIQGHRIHDVLNAINKVAFDIEPPKPFEPPTATDPVPAAGFVPTVTVPIVLGGVTGEQLHGFHDTLNALLKSGYKIQAVKLVRQLTGWGLKESKNYVEEIPHAFV